jgi:hypothetical protein
VNNKRKWAHPQWAWSIENGNTKLARFYDRLDWTKQDIELARETGYSRERIRQVRVQLGKPKSPNHKRYPQTEMQKAMDALLAQHVMEENGRGRIWIPKREIAKRTGYSPLTVQIKLSQFGISANCREKADWANVDWGLNNKLLGEIWGIKHNLVSMHRYLHDCQSPEFFQPNGPRYRAWLAKPATQARIARQRELAQAFREKLQHDRP